MAEHGPAELDIRNIMSLLWRNKFVFFVAIVMSLVSSAYLVSKTPKIYQAQAIVELENSSNASGEIEGLMRSQMNLGSLIMPGSVQPKKTGVIPTIMGREFLLSFVKKYNVRERIDYSYNFSSPPLFSFAGILDRLGIFSLDPPNSEQEDETIINKMRSLIAIEQYKYGQIKTKAFRLKASHKDPYTAAFLANTIAEHFFNIMEEKDKASYIEKMTFLSKVVAEAQLNYTASQQKIERFLIKHPSFFEGNFFQSNLNNTVFPEAEKRVSQLADLSSQKDDLLSSLNKLNSLSENNKIRLRDFDTIVNRKNLSNLFLEELERIGGDDISSSTKTRRFREKIGSEIIRLKSLLSKVDALIVEREKEVTDDLDLNDLFSELKLGLAIDKGYLENSKTALKEFSSKAGREILNKYQIYSAATPPIYPATPNIRYTLLLNISFFILIAMIFVFFRQIMRPRIFDLNQISGSYQFNQTMKIKNTFFPKFGHISYSPKNISSVSIGFFNAIKEGKVGCFIEVGEKSFFKRSSAATVVFHFTELLSKSYKSILCIGNEIKFSKQHYKKSLEFELVKGEKTKSGAEVICSDKEMINVNNMNLFPLGEDYEQCEKIMIAAHAELTAEIKFYLIEKCDFFVLVGKSGRFKREHLDRFISDKKVFEHKCRGFVLVD